MKEGGERNPSSPSVETTKIRDLREGGEVPVLGRGDGIAAGGGTVPLPCVGVNKTTEFSVTVTG